MKPKFIQITATGPAIDESLYALDENGDVWAFTTGARTSSTGPNFPQNEATG
jgi:hypothetical protein